MFCSFLARREIQTITIIQKCKDQAIFGGCLLSDEVSLVSPRGCFEAAASRNAHRQDPTVERVMVLGLSHNRRTKATDGVVLVVH